VPHSSFVGRETELAELFMLLRGRSRLISITGPGGVESPGATGKTSQAGSDFGRILRDAIESVDQLQKEIMPIIEQVRKDKGLDIIFDVGKSGVAFMSPALDLTAEILRRYDALKAAPPAKK
jgi:flagellar hook-basal body complex protein FliE